jgi:hypothetical protein
MRREWSSLTTEFHSRDRNNIASAKLVGLTETLGITNNEYNTCLLMFYVGCKSHNTHMTYQRHIQFPVLSSADDIQQTVSPRSHRT